jgi:hypothetical protein
LIKSFESYGIHATWASVGLLFTPSINVLHETIQNYNINYNKEKYSPYRFTSDELSAIPFEILNAQNEIEQILNTPFQDLASHTYSHFYALEEGQTELDFKKDLELMSNAGEQLQHQFKSIVFPRNQINNNYLQLLANTGYLTFRGNQENNLWASSPYAKESIFKKGKRVIDAYYNLSKSNAYTIDNLEIVNGLVNIPANRFLRPSTGKNILEKRKLKVIKEEMSIAAERGEIYHLWWHPHNFSSRTEQHFEQLEAILDHFKNLNKQYGFQTLNMSEIGEERRK